MKNSSCSKKYPKQFLLETQTNENGYPLYRRRAPEAGGFTAKVKIRGREEVTIDNRWVVPYSPLLSKIYPSHRRKWQGTVRMRRSRLHPQNEGGQEELRT
ncbi:hypothetical protein LAZ67_19001682 [Cordylochernes scorpioides]|uniref:Uncharacterized protein n=1 Tax=Cordylochernes scorpioides TaxID=51811 RepID=A0ABY6LHW5_9ARAC|nr:hypothetical protein LAZ67_19001682 [Cordylochernes scorpioides]